MNLSSNSNEISKLRLIENGDISAPVAVARNDNHSSDIIGTCQADLHREISNEITVANKHLTGVDIFVHHGACVDSLAGKLNRANSGSLSLKMISNHDAEVWPTRTGSIPHSDDWRCRFVGEANQTVDHRAISQLLSTLLAEEVEVVRKENLYEFDGKPKCLLAQK